MQISFEEFKNQTVNANMFTDNQNQNFLQD